MKKRHVNRDIENEILKRLRENQVVVLEGAKAVGKTTVARRVCKQLNGRYLTLDDPVTVSQLKDNPNLVGDGSQFTVVDEIQKMPELVSVVKKFADERGDDGLYLITGSGDRFRMKIPFKALANRKTNLLMRPYSQHEINANRQPESGPGEHGEEPPRSGNLIDAMIEGRSPPQKLKPVPLEKAVAIGGYPRVYARASGNMKAIKEEYIFEEIVVDALYKEKVAGISAKRKFYTKLTSGIGYQRNISELAKKIGETNYMAERIYEFLTNSYLIEELPSFNEEIRGREVLNKEKMYINDSGLATTMLQLDGTNLRSSPYWGYLVENFVLSELRKHNELSSTDLSSDFYFYREKKGIEVDILLDLGKEVIAFEVKSAKELNPSDRENLVEFKRFTGTRCRRTILFYGGDETVKYYDGTEAWPIASLVRPW